MVEALSLTGDERLLENGTGYGWQTALLAQLAGARCSLSSGSPILPRPPAPRSAAARTS
jgi:protein-L-isoaspartate O-methyltransferase